MMLSVHSLTFLGVLCDVFSSHPHTNVYQKIRMKHRKWSKIRKQPCLFSCIC